MYTPSRRGGGHGGGASSPGTGHHKGSAATHQHHVADGPIMDFATIVESTTPDEWQKRTQSLRQLIDIIPSGSAYYDDGPMHWYNSPPTLRHLALPVAALLKDARSTVVKRTCESLTSLFNKCQSDARYLFKDLMPTILSVCAQTAQIIRQSVQQMVLESIPEVRCKMVMPLWMDRLKCDKSRTVREACSTYLDQALKCWTDEGYLTQEIWMQVGVAFIRTMRDPSPDVRANAKSSLEYLMHAQPDLWEDLINDEQGPAAKDPKLLKWLKALGLDSRSADTDDLSVASKYSYNSDSRYGLRSSSPTAASRPSPTNRRWLDTIKSPDNDIPEPQSSIPTSIGISVSSSAAGAARNAATSSGRSNAIAGGGRTTIGNADGGGQPLRPMPPFQQVMEQAGSATPPSSSRLSGTPPRPPPSAGGRKTPNIEPSVNESTSSLDDDDAVMEDTKRYTTSSNDDNGSAQPSSPKFPADLNQAFTSAVQITAKEDNNHRQATVSSPVTDAAGIKEQAVEQEEDQGPVIGSMAELKEHASKRRSRNSLMMQERFRMSSGLSSSGDLDVIVVDDEEDKSRVIAAMRSEEENHAPTNGQGQTPVTARTTPSAQPPEHMVLAIRLLRSHKDHVDSLMNTLRIEMDVLRDFDKLLEQAGRPTEDEVLDYFESVGLCLDQRTTAGRELQREMDRISGGQSPSS